MTSELKAKKQNIDQERKRSYMDTGQKVASANLQEGFNQGAG